MAEQADLDKYPDRIAEMFENKTVFLTGGTGFLGKIITEKLLRACSGLRKIIFIIRTKKGKDPNERLQLLLNDPVFDLVKKEKGEDIMKKIEAVAGDMVEPGLALSHSDREMLKEEVDFIFHCAANVRFDEAMKGSLMLNIGGTKEMLSLAKECKKLTLFSHVSTAYCQPQEKVLFEKVYPAPADPHAILEIVRNKDSDEIETFAKKILGDYPNNYAFAKALSEKLVTDEMNNLPIVLTRPSVVIPAWREPIPGWTDNVNGPIGLLIAAGKGVLRTIYCNSDCYADFLPVDVAANGIIVASYDYFTHKKRRIYNLTSSYMYKISWNDITELGRVVVETRIPLNYVAWYPGGSMTSSKLYHTIRFYLFHLVPAIFVDMILFILGYRTVLLRVQRRIYKGYDLMEYYINNQWDFNNNDSLEARSLLNPKERQIYKLDGEGMVYLDYFTDCVSAARKFILKETEESIPTARRYMTIMWFVDRFVKTLAVIYLTYTLVPRIMLGIARYWNSLDP